MIDATLPLAQPQPLVRVADLALYLRKQGWQRVAHPNERLLVFEKSLGGDRARKLVFASRDEYADAPALIANALEVLADEQGVSWQQLARSVHSIDRDILTVRLISAQASSGGLPLDAAAKLVSQLRDFLSYAACVEDRPGPTSRRPPRLAGNTPGNAGSVIRSPAASASPLSRPPASRSRHRKRRRPPLNAASWEDSCEA